MYIPLIIDRYSCCHPSLSLLLVHSSVPSWTSSQRQASWTQSQVSPRRLLISESSREASENVEQSVNMFSVLQRIQKHLKWRIFAEGGARLRTGSPRGPGRKKRKASW